MIKNHRFQVRNSNEQILLDAIEVGCEVLERELKLEEVELMAQRQAGWAGSDANHLGMWEYAKNTLKINFRNLQGFNLSEIIEILGHEFRHVVQSRNKIAVARDVKFFNPTFLEHYSRWINRPVEIDAINHQQIYRDLVLNDPEFKVKFGNHYELVEGVKNKKQDRKSTYARIGLIEGKDVVCGERESDKVWILRLAEVQKFAPKCKKITQKFVNLAFKEIGTDKREYFEYDMVDVEFQDLLS